jgi:hypothetical protein
MTEEDESDRFLKEQMQLITETPQRGYYADIVNKTLVASWKSGRENQCCAGSFQKNAVILTQLIEQKKPKYLVIDCRNLGFEITDEEQRWYIQHNKSFWLGNKIKKVALIFKSNLSVQIGIEALIDMAMEEGIKPYPFRIFENIPDALSWVRNS